MRRVLARPDDIRFNWTRCQRPRGVARSCGDSSATSPPVRQSTGDATTLEDLQRAREAPAKTRSEESDSFFFSPEGTQWHVGAGPVIWEFASCVQASRSASRPPRRRKYALYWLFDEDERAAVERDDRPPFRIDPDKPFLIALGRGSGWNGLSTTKITHDGQVVMVEERHRYEDGATKISWERATAELSREELAQMLEAVERERLMKLYRSYSARPHIHDGTQWVLWIKQGESEKSVYFNNSFPKPIIRFAKQIDEIIATHNAKLTWQPAPNHDDKDVRASIDRRMLMRAQPLTRCHFLPRGVDKKARLYRRP